MSPVIKKLLAPAAVGLVVAAVFIVPHLFARGALVTTKAFPHFKDWNYVASSKQEQQEIWNLSDALKMTRETIVDGKPQQEKVDLDVSQGCGAKILDEISTVERSNYDTKEHLDYFFIEPQDVGFLEVVDNSLNVSIDKKYDDTKASGNGRDVRLIVGFTSHRISTTAMFKTCMNTLPTGHYKRITRFLVGALAIAGVSESKTAFGCKQSATDEVRVDLSSTTVDYVQWGAGSVTLGEIRKALDVAADPAKAANEFREHISRATIIATQSE